MRLTLDCIFFLSSFVVISSKITLIWKTKEWSISDVSMKNYLNSTTHSHRSIFTMIKRRSNDPRISRDFTRSRSMTFCELKGPLFIYIVYRVYLNLVSIPLTFCFYFCCVWISPIPRRVGTYFSSRRWCSRMNAINIIQWERLNADLLASRRIRIDGNGKSAWPRSFQQVRPASLFFFFLPPSRRFPVIYLPCLRRISTSFVSQTFPMEAVVTCNEFVRYFWIYD